MNKIESKISNYFALIADKIRKRPYFDYKVKQRMSFYYAFYVGKIIALAEYDIKLKRFIYIYYKETNTRFDLYQDMIKDSKQIKIYL